jgi:hypothetical protein
VNVGSCLGLPRLSQKRIPLMTVWQFLGLGTQALGRLAKTIREGQNVFETASLHNSAPFKNGSATGLSVTDGSLGRAVINPA